LLTSPLRLTTSNFIFQLNTCGYSPYVTSSLTRGWVCRLQLLLVSPAQSFSGPSPARLMTILYCLTFETPPTWRPRSQYLYASGTGWPGYTPRHWVPFTSPPTTRRATVEVFDPSSTWSGSSAVMTTPRYIARARTSQKTKLPIVIPELRVTQPLFSNGSFSGSTVLDFSKYTTM
jgi:hypothetical protein